MSSMEKLKEFAFTPKMMSKLPSNGLKKYRNNKMAEINTNPMWHQSKRSHKRFKLSRHPSKNYRNKLPKKKDRHNNNSITISLDTNQDIIRQTLPSLTPSPHPTILINMRLVTEEELVIVLSMDITLDFSQDSQGFSDDNYYFILLPYSITNHIVYTLFIKNQVQFIQCCTLVSPVRHQTRISCKF